MVHRHTTKFKQEAVRIALSSGLTRRQIASGLGIVPKTRSWAQCRHYVADWALPSNRSFTQQNLKVFLHSLGPQEIFPDYVNIERALVIF